jgi:predicted membrane channel-forming protein YqfA (hemolysin III family)
MKSHRTDALSLFFGVAFILISGGYLASSYLRFDLPEAGWFIAGALIFLGLVGAITALVPPRPTNEDEKRPADGEPVDGPMLAE